MQLGFNSSDSNEISFSCKRFEGSLAMVLSIVFVFAAVWTLAPSSAYASPTSNSTRKIMRLSATFSIASPDEPSIENRFGNRPDRPSNPEDSQIIFRHGDTIVTLSPGRIDKTITQGVLQMTLEIDRAIASEGKALAHDQNTIFSPASISMALALVMLGAQGQTLREVSKVLGIATPDDLKDRSDLVHDQFGTLLARFGRNPSTNTPTQISIANAIFIQQGYPIYERYERLSRNVYRSDIVPLDFKKRGDLAVQTINRWVDTKTFGRISEFLSAPPSPDTQVLLASAIYFNGEWENPFPIEATKRRPFYVSGSKQNEPGSEVIEVTMMANGVELPYFNDANLACQIVGLPYKGNQVAMYVVLPNARGYEGLNALKERLTVPVLESLVSKTQVTSVIISMPRMKLEATLNLKSTLESMGLRSLFDSKYSDLGQISPGIRSSRPTYRPSVAPDNSNSRPTYRPSVASDNSNSRPTYRPSVASDNSDRRSTYRPFVASDNSDRRSTYPPYVASDNSDSDVFTFSSRFGGSNETSDDVQEENNQQAESRRVTRQNPNPGLYVDDVIHKVEIEVTETGTVASATTAVTISRDGSHRVVRLDRPFLFFIRHEESKLMLFWGAVVRPT